MINLSFFFFLLSCLVSSRLSRTLSRYSERRENVDSEKFSSSSCRDFSRRSVQWRRRDPRGGRREPRQGSRDHQRGIAVEGHRILERPSREIGETRCSRKRQEAQARIRECDRIIMYIDALLYIRNNSKICRAKLREWCFLERINWISDLFPSLFRSQFAKNFSKPPPLFLFQNISLSSIVGNYYSTWGDEHLILSFLSGEYRINTECIDPSLRRIRCWKWKVWWLTRRGTSDLPIGVPPMWVSQSSFSFLL